MGNHTIIGDHLYYKGEHMAYSYDIRWFYNGDYMVLYIYEITHGFHGFIEIM